MASDADAEVAESLAAETRAVSCIGYWLHLLAFAPSIHEAHDIK
jgi:hypothetical protein